MAKTHSFAVIGTPASPAAASKGSGSDPQRTWIAEVAAGDTTVGSRPTWWRKEGDEYRNTLQELQRPKIGRMARLKGTVEQVAPPLAQIADAKPVAADPSPAGHRTWDIRDATLKISEGRPVLIFPDGTCIPLGVAALPSPGDPEATP